MKTRKPVRIDVLFPQLDDPAFQKLGDLEELVANFIARRATSPFKLILQRGIAKLSQLLVDYSDEERSAATEPLLVDALKQCRRIAGAIYMLYRAGIFSRPLASAAFDLVAEITQLLIERLCAARGEATPGLLQRPVLEPIEGGVTEDSGGGGPPPLAS